MKVPVAVVAWSDDNFNLIVRGMLRKPTDDIYMFHLSSDGLQNTSQGRFLKIF